MFIIFQLHWGIISHCLRSYDMNLLLYGLKFLEPSQNDLSHHNNKDGMDYYFR